MINNRANLLIITDGFPDIRNNKYKCHFVFEYAKLIKNDFNEIFVISPQAKIPKLFSNIPIIKKFENDFGFANYQFDNISVFFPKIGFFPFSIFSKKLKSLLTISAIKNILTGKKFDLIHSHFISPAGYTASKLKNIYKKPLIITSHEGDIIDFFKNNHLNIKKIRKTFKNVDHVIAVSEINRKTIVSNFPFVDKKISTINNFVDLEKFKIIDKFEARKKLGLDANQKIILNVANLLTKKKGQLDLIEIIDNLSKKIDNTALYLIGEGPDRKKIEDEINKRGIPKNIKLLGPLKNELIVLWYNAADVFVFPSYFESFGIVQIEALACGIPVIAYANNGSNEVLSSEVGQLVKIGDKKSLELKIEGILNGKMPKNFSRSGYREYVRKRFSGKTVRKKLIGIYFKFIQQELNP